MGGGGGVGDDEEDRQALVRHAQSILGLKVADAEEAFTVRRMGASVLGLVVLIALHFVVHVFYGGRVLHSVGHFVSALMLPMLGYVAVSQRSTRAAWAFHLMSVVASVVHAGSLWVALSQQVPQLQPRGPQEDCSLYSAPCSGDLERLQPGEFGPDGSELWRCLDGACVAAQRRCDGVFNCFDRSDELDCEVAAPADELDALAVKEKKLERCSQLAWAREHRPRLQLWWLLVTPPLWALCLFAAYHSLEFYVQLRVRRLAAKLDHATAQATIFEVEDHDED